MKYVLVTGGIVSGLGKGITASSIGVLLKTCGVSVTAIKIDPYLNVDAGTMSPFEHGEVFVLEDGAEGDLDLGNYERFLDINLTKDHNITTGKVYSQVIERERRGEFLGKTVQVVPHVTNAIKEWIERVALLPVESGSSTRVPDVCVIELGGTIGDMESMPFVEALRQLQFQVGQGNMCCVHLSLVPLVGNNEEQKTKPTQHSVSTLRSLGLAPDVLACRCSVEIEIATKEKLAMFCHVPYANVMSLHDVTNIWHVPLLMESQGVHTTLCNLLGLHGFAEALDLKRWRSDVAYKWDLLEKEVNIAVVGKYIENKDAYLSIVKAIQHASMEIGVRPIISWVDACKIEEYMEGGDVDIYEQKQAMLALQRADGILIPGGFGARGLGGMILAAQHARVHKKPLLGICLGMQVTVIEYCRHVLGIPHATSEEFVTLCREPVVVMMPECKGVGKGGSMRLGSHKVVLVHENSHSYQLHGNQTVIHERHRHRYEVNPSLISMLESKGLKIAGKDEKKERVEIVELDRSEHPFYVAAQYHPEYKSRPGKPAPLFQGFLQACVGFCKKG